jgi:hypothetical protein
MKSYFLLVLVALGLVAFMPQKSKADGYFGISVGPAYCDPYPVYYGGYYPHYYRHYYYETQYGHGLRALAPPPSLAPLARRR